MERIGAFVWTVAEQAYIYIYVYNIYQIFKNLFCLYLTNWMIGFFKQQCNLFPYSPFIYDNYL